ncbi:MAG: hypothetical protein CSA96_04650 [Bacteroidetes bacterium]|nr:MAG: hypothetical protein CSA96_04650 [Bacteroidota bacterium]
MKQTDINIEERYLKKYLDGNCSRQEFELAFELISSPESNEKYNEVWEAHWNCCLQEDGPADFSFASPGKVSKAVKKKQLFIQRSVFSYAAILAILLSAGWLLRTLRSEKLPAYNEQYLAGMEQTLLELRDGSEVSLGAGSQLKISDNFDQKRELLLNGEATFNVENIHDKGFQVHTSAMTVRVIGTSFKVRHFENEPDMQVTVRSGKVEVVVANERQEKRYVLSPDMQLSYNKTSGRVVTRKVDSNKLMQDDVSTLYFDQTPFYQLVTDIKRIYGVELKLSDSEIGKFELSGAHSNESLDDLLTSVCFVSGFRYEWIDDTHLSIKSR